MLHITVIANGKEEKKNWRVVGEDMQRQGTLGASGGRKRKETREMREDGWRCGKTESGTKERVK